MNASDEAIRELTDGELDRASGGEPNLGGYVYCVGEGLKVPGGCTPTYGDIINIILDTVDKGKQIQQQYGGGGRPK